MTRMSIDQAAEIARHTGDTRHLNDHWNRTRVALLHDCIRDFLDDPPPAVGMGTRMRLSAAASALRTDLDRMGARS